MHPAFRVSSDFWVAAIGSRVFIDSLEGSRKGKAARNVHEHVGATARTKNRPEQNIWELRIAIIGIAINALNPQPAQPRAALALRHVLSMPPPAQLFFGSRRPGIRIQSKKLHRGSTSKALFHSPRQESQQQQRQQQQQPSVVQQPGYIPSNKRPTRPQVARLIGKPK